MNSRKKLLYISSVLPDTTCGAHIAIYRHFVVKNDFDYAVCGFVSDGAVAQNKFRIVRGKLVSRFFNSRFSRLAYNIEYLINWYRLPKSLLRYAKEYKADAIVTVPDNMHSGLAYLLSKQLNLPLITNFQDLFPISRFIPRFMEPYGWVRKVLLKKFFKLHKESDVVFYTSEGMKLFFGDHRNGHVLYPIGDFNIANTTPVDHDVTNVKPVKIVYAGNCYGAYGRMLLAFSKLVKNVKDIQFKIFPVGKGWTDEDINEMKAAGIYQDFLPFEMLKKELAASDAFLTVMSFEESESPFVKTSFTTKWLDYAPYGKPVFVWGPAYSSGVVFAKKFNCGITVLTPEAADLQKAITDTAGNLQAWKSFSSNIKKVSEETLNPNKIHAVFVNQVNAVLKADSPAKTEKA